MTSVYHRGHFLVHHLVDNKSIIVKGKTNFVLLSLLQREETLVRKVSFVRLTVGEWEGNGGDSVLVSRPLEGRQGL